MFAIFTDFATWLIYNVIGLSPDSRLGQAAHFFVEDVSKIFFLLIVMIYGIALLRASLNIEKVRDFLAGKNRWLGYGLGSVFGAITPFCSCSSIPVFLGFTSAGIPLGTTMAFLITSPLINEVAVLLLLSLVGWKITLLYVVLGLAVGIISGFILTLLKAERWLQPFVQRAAQTPQRTNTEQTPAPLRLKDRHVFAYRETKEIFSRVWLWVFIGVGLGAALHGFVPAGWLEARLGDGQWWSVPGAVLLGIPLYSNATGVIPVMEGLLNQGVPLGTTMAFCMSTVAASFPEFVLLKQVMRWQLLLILLALLLLAFTLIGWLLNVLSLQTFLII